MDPVVFEETGDAGGERCSIMSGGGRIWRRGVVRADWGAAAAGLRRISCGCCGRCGLLLWLEFELDGATAAAIRKTAAEIGQVSCERIRDELTMILTEGGGEAGV